MSRIWPFSRKNRRGAVDDSVDPELEQRLTDLVDPYTETVSVEHGDDVFLSLTGVAAKLSELLERQTLDPSTSLSPEDILSVEEYHAMLSSGMAGFLIIQLVVEGTQILKRTYPRTMTTLPQVDTMDLHNYLEPQLVNDGEHLAKSMWKQALSTGGDLDFNTPEVEEVYRISTAENSVKHSAVLVCALFIFMMINQAGSQLEPR